MMFAEINRDLSKNKLSKLPTRISALDSLIEL